MHAQMRHVDVPQRVPIPAVLDTGARDQDLRRTESDRPLMHRACMSGSCNTRTQTRTARAASLGRCTTVGSPMTAFAFLQTSAVHVRKLQHTHADTDCTARTKSAPQRAPVLAPVLAVPVPMPVLLTATRPTMSTEPMSTRKD